MITGHIIGALLPNWQSLWRPVRRRLFRLGGLGLIPLGLLDSSIIPVPGSMDVMTIILTARDEPLWIYYAVMATAGSVIGGLITYSMARKGGKGMLERRFSALRAEKAYQIFERWGFGAIVVPSFLPPPVPMVPFLLAAGAMKYPLRKFLAAFTLGRFARYMILAYLAARYGRRIIASFRNHGQAVIWAVVAMVVAMAIVAFFFYWRDRQAKGSLASS